MKRIKVGEQVSWQRALANKYTGTILVFCLIGIAIADALDLSKFSDMELRRIDLERNSINRYLIYVQNIGVVSVASTTIEKQNPNVQYE